MVNRKFGSAGLKKRFAVVKTPLPNTAYMKTKPAQLRISKL